MMKIMTKSNGFPRDEPTSDTAFELWRGGIPVCLCTCVVLGDSLGVRARAPMPRLEGTCAFPHAG